jgi:hypothetical protein
VGVVEILCEKFSNDRAVVQDADRVLLAEVESGFSQFVSQRVFVDLFQKAWPQRVGHLERAADDLFGQRVQVVEVHDFAAVLFAADLRGWTQMFHTQMFLVENACGSGHTFDTRLRSSRGIDEAMIGPLPFSLSSSPLRTNSLVAGRLFPFPDFFFRKVLL